MKSREHQDGESRYSVVGTVGEDGGPRRRFRIGMITIGDVPYLEARIYYQSQGGEMLPTRKGVVITASNFLLVETILATKGEALRKWLGLTFVNDDSSSEYQTHVAATVNAPLLTNIEWRKTISQPTQTAFTIVHKGSVTVVDFNLAHPWVYSRLENADDKSVQILAEWVAATSFGDTKAQQSSDGDSLNETFRVSQLHASRALVSLSARKQP